MFSLIGRIVFKPNRWLDDSTLGTDSRISLNHGLDLWCWFWNLLDPAAGLLLQLS